MVFKKRTFKKKSFRKKTFSPKKVGYNGTMSMYRDPPNIEVDMSFVKRFRFQCTIPGSGNAATVVTISDAFLSRLVMQSVSSTTAYPLLASYKILELEMWMPPNGSQGSTTNTACSITWLGGGLAADKVVCANSLSFDRPAYLRTFPPKNSQASFWALAQGNSNVYFAIGQQANGAILDLVMACKLEVGPSGTTTLNSAGYGNQLLYGRLDGIPSATTGYWIPVTSYVDLGVE